VRIIGLYQSARDKAQIAIRDELEQIANALVKSSEATDK
jgi:hypothetical protein